MKIKLHQRPQKNSISLLIEYYLGSIKENGKTKHHRKFETLPFKLVKNPKSQQEKKENKKKRELARRIIAKRELEIAQNKEGFFSNKGKSIYLLNYFEKLLEERKKSKGNYGNWYSALKHLKNYTRSNITLSEVDVEFVKGFKEYLLHKPITKSQTPLSRNSAVSYFNKFRACMNQAFNERLIQVNPVIGVKGIKAEVPKREFLTLEELKAIANVDCRFQVLKHAFLFSCYTGMRWSDIQKLAWSDINQIDDLTFRITFRQQKTKGQEYLDIPKHVIDNYTSGKGDVDERVFVGLKYSAWHNIELNKWIMRAGITKDITFHCARHTFATLQLNLGTDIFTVSKLLGHSELKTTQIYAKIMNQKKRDAMNIIPNINL